MNWLAMARVAAAMGLGGCIGLDRELARKPAGLRTHMLLAGASSLLTEVGLGLMRQYAPGQNPSIRIDPIIIIQAVATAVGFIGGGTILRHDKTDRVEGLTTAASLLFVSAIGLATSSGLLELAAVVTAFALVVLRGIGWAERRIHVLNHRRDPGGP